MDAGIRFCILILGAVSTVAGYVGLTTAMPHDGFWWKAFAAIIAVAIGVAVATFWRVAFEVTIRVIQQRFQTMAWLTVVAGCFIIAGMSAWWHAAAIAGGAAKTAAIHETLADAEGALAKAEQSRTGSRAMLARVETLAQEVGAMAACERDSGCVTGSAGAKGVFGLLSGLRDKAEGIAQSVRNTDARFDQRLAEGKACLAEFRAAPSRGAEAGGDESNASSAFDCINAVVAEIDGNAQLERIAQDMEALTTGLVVPATIRSDAQRQAVANILAGFGERAKVIAADARAAIRPSDIAPITLNRMSAMKGVIVYAAEIAPALATALALDFFPVLLLLFKAIGVASTRARPDAELQAFTAAELLKAFEIFAVMREAGARNLTVPHPIMGTAIDTGTTTPAKNRITYANEDGEGDYVEEDIDIVLDDAPADRVGT